MLGRDVVAVGRQAAEVRRPLLHQRQPPVGEVRGDLHTHVGHQPRALADEYAHVVEPDRRGPIRGGELLRAPLPPALGRVRDQRRLAPVVARVWHVVLEDHLLEVAVLGVYRGERLQRRHAIVRRLADAHEDPAGEWDPELTGQPDRLEPAAGVLGGRAAVDDQVGDHRLEHQPLRGGHLAEQLELVPFQDAEVRVRKEPAVQGSLTRPADVRREVRVPVLLDAPRDLGVHLRALAGQHEQLLHPAPRGVVQHALDLVGRVQVRLMRGERAVPAVAATRPRQRQCEVAAEGDPAHLRGVYAGRSTGPKRAWISPPAPFRSPPSCPVG